jgi:hypothetical protein
MPVFPRPSSPKAAFEDLRNFVRHRSKDQWVGLVAAIAVTVAIIVIFILDSDINTTPGPQVIYVESYSANRSDAEIVADQKKDQAAREAAAREKQRQFQKLEKQLGI